jgi:hypothetical protein
MSGDQNSWDVERRRAIERFVEALNQYHDKSDSDAELVHRAVDVVTVAHIAAQFEWEGGPLTNWEDKLNRAMERVVTAWEECQANDDPIAREELNIALDGLAIANAAWTFEFAGGPLNWQNPKKPKKCL